MESLAGFISSAVRADRGSLGQRLPPDAAYGAREGSVGNHQPSGVGLLGAAPLQINEI